jgi:hypothetical protein
MTPKEKAIELIGRHTLFLGDDGALNEYWTNELEAKRHSIKTVNEILNLPFEFQSERKYWQEVKQEIEKL